MKAVSDSFRKEYITEGMNDYEKVKAAHDYVALNTVYDAENYRKDTVPWESFQAYGSLLYGVAVCESYAKATKILLEELGYETRGVSGTVNGGEGHAWIKVKIGTNWYNIDTTWDDMAYSNYPIRHDYFLITDENLAQDHDWDREYYKDYAATSEKYM